MKIAAKLALYYVKNKNGLILKLQYIVLIEGHVIYCCRNTELNKIKIGRIFIRNIKY